MHNKGHTNDHYCVTYFYAKVKSALLFIVNLNTLNDISLIKSHFYIFCIIIEYRFFNKNK